ncbi:MAG: hypothetical protein HYX86_05470 [Chloroflexi bacterium]|nr:hypothetical protein [Chloroflexota bacterium]
MNPLLLPLGILVVSPIVYILRRNSLMASWLSIITCLFAFFLLWTFPFTSPSQALGRPIHLDDFREIAMSFMLLGSILFFLYAWRISQGWSFFPFILFGDGLLALAVMIDSPLLSTIFLVMVGVITLLLIPGGIEGRTRGALAFMISLGIAGPLLFASSWLLDQAAHQPDNLYLARTTALTLALGFGVLFAALPLGFYLVSVVHDAPPLVSGFLATIYSTMAFFVLLHLLDLYPWLGEEGQIFDLFLWGGILTAFAGGIFSLAQKSAAGLMAYALLADGGVILAGLGTGSGEGIAASIAHVFTRFLAVALMAMSWGSIRFHWGLTAPQFPAGAIKSLPWAGAGYFLGGLALAGLPGTGNFATRWLVASAVETHQALGGLALWGGGALVFWRFLSLLASTLGGSSPVGMWKERVVPLLVISLFLANLLMGVAPQFFLELAQRILSS